MANEPAAGGVLQAGVEVEVIEAWPREFRSRQLRLGPGATVADALEAAGIAPGAYPAVAVFGERVALDHVLDAGDRVELLRPLEADPKEARRRRAAATQPGGQGRRERT